MKVKCDYCRADIEDTDEKCPHCGADNSHLKRVGAGVPQTIEELKKWYIDHNLPDENVTRFFIGKNYTAPKAFGIYKEENTGNIIVYKNKADGTRSIRYEGKDEVYAVNELYIKLKEEIINQKQRNIDQKQNNLGKSNIIENIKNGYEFKTERTILMVAIAIIAIVVIVAVLVKTFIPSNGYYNYNGSYYYYQSGTWYKYDNGQWDYSEAPDDLKHQHDDYYYSSDYDYSTGIDDFSDTDYYQSDSSSSDDWDSGSSWDSDSSWDSSSTDWDSDW